MSRIVFIGLLIAAAASSASACTTYVVGRKASATGRVIVLDCPLETLKARLTGGDRPLSADAAKLEALVKSRAAHYASFPNHVEMV